MQLLFDSKDAYRLVKNEKVFEVIFKAWVYFEEEMKTLENVFHSNHVL